MFEIVPSLAAAFGLYWVKKMEAEAGQARQVPSTTYAEIDWLCVTEIPRAEIFTCLTTNEAKEFLSDTFTETQWAALPFVAPCKELQDLKEAYCAKDVMFVTYCVSTSVPMDLRKSVGGHDGDDEVPIDWSNIEDKDIGMILSDSRRLMCTLPSNPQQSVAFQANILNK